MRNLELFQDPPRAAVYVLRRRDRQRLKIGWSLATMFSQMPLAEGAHRWIPVALLQSEAAPLDAVSVDTGPQDTWWALEDLWLRLAVHCRVTVEREADVHHVVIKGFKQAWDGPVATLRRVVTNAATYRWRTAGHCGDFARLFEHRGDDLVCTLAGLRLIDSWPDGPDLVWQVEAFLLRLGRSTSTGVGSAASASGERA